MDMFSFHGTQHNVGLNIWYHRSPDVSQMERTSANSR